jgi:hypothetical protein
MQGTGQRAFAEVDDRAPQYPPGLIDTKLYSAIAIEEAQPILALMHADALFANARYCVRLHQYRNLGRLKVEQLSEPHRSTTISPLVISTCMSLFLIIIRG